MGIFDETMVLNQLERRPTGTPMTLSNKYFAEVGVPLTYKIGQIH
jgi:hypothetical protein